MATIANQRQEMHIENMLHKEDVDGKRNTKRITKAIHTFMQRI